LYDINNLNNSYLTRSSKFPVFQPILDDSYEYASQIGEEKNRGAARIRVHRYPCSYRFYPHLPGQRIGTSEIKKKITFLAGVCHKTVYPSSVSREIKRGGGQRGMWPPLKTGERAEDSKIGSRLVTALQKLA
jgi:hypothetical protein